MCNTVLQLFDEINGQQCTMHSKNLRKLIQVQPGATHYLEEMAAVGAHPLHFTEVAKFEQTLVLSE